MARRCPLACHSAKQIWWAWPSWLRRQIVALKIVGSNPIVHPIKITPSEWMVLFLWERTRWDSKDQSHTPVGCALPLAGRRQHLTFATAKGRPHRPPHGTGRDSKDKSHTKWDVHCRWLDSGNTLLLRQQKADPIVHPISSIRNGCFLCRKPFLHKAAGRV